MNRPVALLQVVGVNQGAGASDLVKEVVLETEHRGRAHDGGLGVDGTNDLLSPRLCWLVHLHVDIFNTESTNLGGEVLRGRIPAGIVGRDVDESVHIVLSNGLGDALSTINVDVSEREVPIPPLITYCSPI